MNTSTKVVAQAAGIVGEVNALSGVVLAIGSNGLERALAVGDPVYAGDEIRTVGNGTTIIEFENGRRLTLGPSSETRLDEALYSGNPQVPADIAELQAEILAGADPGEVTDPPAAGGPGAPGESYRGSGSRRAHRADRIGRGRF